MVTLLLAIDYSCVKTATYEESQEKFIQKHRYHNIGADTLRVVKVRPNATPTRVDKNATPLVTKQFTEHDLRESRLEQVARGFHDCLCQYPNQMEAARDRDRTGHILSVPSLEQGNPL